MQGLRTPETDKFKRFFEMIQEEAAKQDCVFFLDCGEGHTFENEHIECEDLCGWLIPSNKVSEFSKKFEDSDSDLEEWSEFIAFIEWTFSDGQKTINIKITRS